jgi:phosphoribosylformylglycinamidine cyclo-ligase
VFRWLARSGGVAEKEMLRTFNCGIGMIVIADSDRAGEVEHALRAAGEDPITLGSVVKAKTADKISHHGKLAL